VKPGELPPEDAERVLQKERLQVAGGRGRDHGGVNRACGIRHAQVGDRRRPNRANHARWLMEQVAGILIVMVEFILRRLLEIDVTLLQQVKA